MNCRLLLLALTLVAGTLPAFAQSKRDTAVREDKQKLASNDSWFYDDLAAAREVAASTARPLMIVFR